MIQKRNFMKHGLLVLAAVSFSAPTFAATRTFIHTNNSGLGSVTTRLTRFGTNPDRHVVRNVVTDVKDNRVVRKVVTSVDRSGNSDNRLPGLSSLRITRN